MIDFDEYKKLGEPDKLEKSEIWKAAIGLQEVDGLQTSEYLHKTAKSNIDGDISFKEVHENLSTYYKTSALRKEIENRTEEADKVSAKIAEILSEKAFVMSPAQYLNIHKRIFEGFKYGGKVRTYNITKAEWVLHGETVYYASASSVMDTLKYDFDAEKSFDYRNLSQEETIHHIADFISGIWQIHPFCEGNTRATAVFAIKYLRTFGYNAQNDMFANHSWYFRNALVRANYTNLAQKIYPDKISLYKFFENLLLNTNHPLKNRLLLLEKNVVDDHVNDINDHVNDKNDHVNDKNDHVNDKNDHVNSVNDHVNDTNDHVNDAVLNLIYELEKEPTIKIKDLSLKLNISEKTVSRRLKELKSKGIIKRIGSPKTGHWQINPHKPKGKAFCLHPNK